MQVIANVIIFCAANSPVSPQSHRASLSNEDKEKIEKLRSSAILTHLKKYSLVGHNEYSML